jgi:hypothetical protein
MAVKRERRPELEAEELRHPVGDGDFARPIRIATLTECEGVAPEDTVRVLCAEVDALHATRDGHRAVPYDLDRPEVFPGGGELGLEVGIRAVEPEDVAGRAVLGVVRRSRVVDDRDAGDRSRDRDGEQC